MLFCRDVMKENLVTCRPTDTIHWCARLMRDWNVGLLPVTGQDGRLFGVVTDRDLTVRVLAEGRPAGTEVSAVMTKDPVVVKWDEALETAEIRMGTAKKSRILVVDEAGTCVGIVSLSDIAVAEKRSRSGSLLSRVTRKKRAPRSTLVI